MAVLERRLQVLIDAERGELLERLARTEGKSVGAVVREAVDQRLAQAGADKTAALGRLLERAAAPDQRPSEDWSVIKANLEDDMYGGLGA
ncbi:MAG: ribbon-helix-helix protein, CopG family [Bifidobacteriaceae bacterium]|nr:ribbon-helix-helix protein, CopG family [Bifidobacteriaceae bacterium]